ncbi:MAG: hypothetical protein ABIJ09_01520 [Pseudomonadota bacterium]
MSDAHEARICELLEKGLQHYGMGEPTRALAIWSEVLSLDPANIRAAEYIKFVGESLQDVAGPGTAVEPTAAKVAPAPGGVVADPSAAPPAESPTGPLLVGDEAPAVVVAPDVAEQHAEPAVPTRPAVAVEPTTPEDNHTAEIAVPDHGSKPAMMATVPETTAETQAALIDDPLAVSWGDLVAPPPPEPVVLDETVDIELSDEVVGPDPGVVAEAAAEVMADAVAVTEPPSASVDQIAAVDGGPEASASTGHPAQDAAQDVSASPSTELPPQPAEFAAPSPEASENPSTPLAPEASLDPASEQATLDAPAIAGIAAATPADEDDLPDVEVEIEELQERSTPDSDASTDQDLASPVAIEEEGRADPAAPSVSPEESAAPGLASSLSTVESVTPDIPTPALAGYTDVAPLPVTPDAPALELMPPVVSPIVGDWGSAFEQVPSDQFQTFGDMLTSSAASSPDENAPVVRESLSSPLPPAEEVVALPAGAPAELREEVSETEAPAGVSDPWDEGPSLSEPVHVKSANREFLDPSSGEHSIEEHSQPSEPGLIDEPISTADADASECERLMQGARDMFDLGDFSGSLELVEKVLEIDAENAEARDYLSRNQGTLLKMYESKIGSFSQVPRVTIPPDEVIWLNLHHRAGFLLAQIDGSMTFEDLLSLSAMSKLETCKILVKLISEGVITAS